MPVKQATVAERAKDAKDSVYREGILDAAEEAFGEAGYVGTRMSEVAGRARISLATLYGRYENKMALYRAVHARRLAELMERVRAVPAGRDRLGGLLGSMRVYIAFHMEHPAYLCMHLREGMAWSGSDELRSPEQVEAWTRGLRAMATAFGRGMDDGLFVRDDPTLCARTVNAMHQVALSHWVDGGMVETPSQLHRRLAAHFVRSFCVPERVPALLARLEED